MTRGPFESHTLQGAQKLVKHTRIRGRVQGSVGGENRTSAALRPDQSLAKGVLHWP